VKELLSEFKIILYANKKISSADYVVFFNTETTVTEDHRETNNPGSLE